MAGDRTMEARKIRRKLRAQMRGRCRAFARRWRPRTDLGLAVGFALIAGPAGWLCGRLLTAVFGGYALAAGAVSMMTVLAVGAVGSLVWAEHRQSLYRERLRVKVAGDLGIDLDMYEEERRLIVARGPKRGLRIVAADPLEVS